MKKLLAGVVVLGALLAGSASGVEANAGATSVITAKSAIVTR